METNLSGKFVVTVVGVAWQGISLTHKKWRGLDWREASLLRTGRPIERLVPASFPTGWRRFQCVSWKRCVKRFETDIRCTPGDPRF